MTKQKHFYLIRGLIRESEHWGDFPKVLQGHFPGSSVTTIDIPGAGKHHQILSPLSVAGMVEHMREEYIHTQLNNEESILVAISLGGMIAAQWMKNHPEDFHKAILINTSYGGISPLFDRMKPLAFTHLLKVPFLKGRSREAHILKIVSNHQHVFDETLDLWEKINEARPVSMANSIRQLTAAARFSIGNWKPQSPILLLAGTKDRLVSVDCSRSIAKTWNVPLIEHPTGGHDLTADDPEWTTKQIVSFVKESAV